MRIVCDEIPITEQVKKAAYGNNPVFVNVRRENKIILPGLELNVVNPCVLPIWYEKYAQQIESIPIREDDVLIASFPKSGTTWVQEMVWLIMHNLDFERARQLTMRQRYTFLERSGISAKKHLDDKSTIEDLETVPSPRFIKTHLPVGLLPIEFWSIKPKLVYVARNPKDVAVSYYHHYCNLMNYKGTLEEFLDSFLNDLVMFAPVHDHVLDYWRERHHQNILFITYEEMSTDLSAVIRTAMNFFEKHYTEQQINELVKHLAFDQMRQNNAVNYSEVIREATAFYSETRAENEFKFMRRGQVNSYVDEMPVQYQHKFDVWTKERLGETGFKFNL